MRELTSLKLLSKIYMVETPFGTIKPYLQKVFKYEQIKSDWKVR